MQGRAWTRLSQLLSALIVLTASGVGVLAFLMPFISPPEQRGFTPAAHASDAPFLFVLLVALGLGAVMADMTLGQMRSQTVAVMGVLAAVGAALRLVPGPGGFSALFLVPIVAGYVYGPTFGFLLGTFTLAVSALVTGGIGPWLPYQMFTTGWVGALSGLWGKVVARNRGGERVSPTRWEVVILAVWGGILGLVYGVIMNLWFWPFVFQAQNPSLYWEPGIGVGNTLARYVAFYLATSLWWDMGRAVGNAMLILAVGRPLIRALRRFRARARFDRAPAPTPVA